MRLRCQLGILPRLFFGMPLTVGLAGGQETASAQEVQRIAPGEAVVTRFSGTAQEGTSASILDLRSRGQVPQGAQW
jgi:hypothetical protein